MMSSSQKRTVLGLALVTAFVTISAALISPIFPLYATSKGAAYRDIGMIAATGSMLHMLASLWLGRAVDRTGPEFMFIVAAVAQGMAAALYPLASGLFLIAAAKVLESASLSAFWPAMEAASTLGNGSTGHAMGTVYTVYPAAFFAASSLSGWITGSYGYSATFILSLCAAAIALLGILSGKWVPRVQWSSLKSTTEPALKYSQRILPGMAVRFWIGISGCATYCLIVSLVWTFLPLLARERAVPVQIVGLLVGTFWLSRVFVSLPAGSLSESTGRGAIMIPSLILGSIGTAIVAMATTRFLMFAGVGLMGMCVGSMAPVGMSLVADCVQCESRGWAMGMCEAFCGLGFFFSGIFGGLIAGRSGVQATFMVTSFFVLAVALIFLALFTRLKRVPPTETQA